MKYTKTIFCLIIVSGLASHTASGQSVLFNFGGTSYSGTNAPGHVDGNATGTVWNSVAVDTASGILDQDGGATSIALDFGTAATTTLDYSAATRAADYTTAIPASPIFSTTLQEGNAVRDAGDPGIGVNVSGLAQGTYDFYLTSFRGDKASNLIHTYDIYAGVDADPITDFSSLSVGSITNTNTISWEATNNYVTGSFIIDATNDNFSILSQTSSSFIGVFTSLEIVQVPEPSAYAMLTAGLALSVVVLRRRIRS